MVSEEQKKHYNDLLKERKIIKKKSGKVIIISFLISFIFGIILGLSAVSVLIKADQEGSMDIDKAIVFFYLALLLFIVLFIFHIIIHEAGHLIFGLMTGYKFLSFRILSIILYKKDGHIHRRKFSVKGTAGQCLMYPPKQREDGSFPFVLYNLGGGLNNLIFSIPFVVPAVLTHNPYARIIYLLLILAGVLMAATNIIPMSPGIQNDGMNLKSMLKDKCMRDAFYLQLKINAELSDGKLITEYSPDEFLLPEGTNDTNMLTAFVRLLSYYQQLAYHNYEAAEKILTSIEEKSTQYQLFILNLLEVERLFFMVLKHSPVEEIAAVYQHSRYILASAKTDIGIQRVRYIYETFMTEDEKKDIMTLINKKPPKKWRECDKDKLYRDVLKVADNFPIAGEAVMYVDIIEDIRKNYRNEDIIQPIFI